MKVTGCVSDPPGGLVKVGPLAWVTLTPSPEAFGPITAAGKPVPGAAALLMIDTGATRTMIDERVMKHLGVAPHSVGLVEGVDGVPQQRPIYRVGLQISVEEPTIGRPWKGGIQMVTDIYGMPISQRGERHIAGLLGRDVLSVMRFNYDGPGGTYTLEDVQQAAAGIPMPTSANVGRNDPCPCGSRKKYKKCCGMAH